MRRPSRGFCWVTGHERQVGVAWPQEPGGLQGANPARSGIEQSLAFTGHRISVDCRDRTLGQRCGATQGVRNESAAVRSIRRTSACVRCHGGAGVGRRIGRIAAGVGRVLLVRCVSHRVGGVEDCFGPVRQGGGAIHATNCQKPRDYEKRYSVHGLRIPPRFRRTRISKSRTLESTAPDTALRFPAPRSHSVLRGPAQCRVRAAVRFRRLESPPRWPGVSGR